MNATAMVVLSELRILRARFKELMNDQSYCTSATERFEQEFDRLLKTVGEDDSE